MAAAFGPQISSGGNIVHPFTGAGHLGWPLHHVSVVGLVELTGQVAFRNGKGGICVWCGAMLRRTYKKIALTWKPSWRANLDRSVFENRDR